MGYTTYFKGHVTIDPPLNAKEVEYLQRFNGTRRMKRKNGPYYVGGTGFMGQDNEEDVIDYNSPSDGQPGLWCQWEPAKVQADADGYPISATALEWDGGEKFYHAAEWMQYLIDHFIGKDPLAKLNNPKHFDFLQGHTVNGEIFATGEIRNDYWKIVANFATGEIRNDYWKIVVKDNIVKKVQGRVVFDDDDNND